MLEWIAFHKTLGVEKFVIYTNDCEDGTVEIAQRLEEMGLTAHVDNTSAVGVGLQHKMLRRARKHPVIRAADWIMCLDVDEFWNIKCGERDFASLISETERKAGQPVDAISFAWKLFGSAGHVSFEDKPVTGSFFMCDEERTYHSGRAFGLKTLFRNNGKFSRFGPHRPKGIQEGKAHEIAWSDAGGNLFPADKVGWRAWHGFSHEFGRLHHYSVRSLDGFLVKRDRGRTNHINTDQGQSYWSDMNANKSIDATIRPVAARAAPLLEELKNDPVLSKLHRSACDWHRAKIKEIKERPDWVEFREWLSDNLV